MPTIPSPRTNGTLSPGVRSPSTGIAESHIPERLARARLQQHTEEQPIEPGTSFANSLDRDVGRNRRTVAATTQQAPRDQKRKQSVDPLNQDLDVNGGSEAKLDIAEAAFK